MFKNKARNEGILYEAPNTRSKINEEVNQELAGNWSFLTDTQGLKRGSTRARRPCIFFYRILLRNREKCLKPGFRAHVKASRRI